jgi:hypothetical protein
MAGPGTDFGDLRSNGKLVPNFELVRFRQSAGETIVDTMFFLALNACKVLAVSMVQDVAGSDGSAVNLQVVKDTGTAAPGAGTDLLTNNAGAGFNLKAAARTPQAGTLVASAASLTLAAGDRLSVDVAGTPTSVAGVLVEVRLQHMAVQQ